MELNRAKLSNYVGQARDLKKVHDHFIMIDRDLQNLWGATNQLISFVPGDNIEDVNIAAITLGTGATAPDNVVVSSTTLLVKGFNGAATTEQLYGTIEIPHAYKQGSNITPHVHWMPTTTDVGNVVWQIEYAFKRDNSSVTITTSTTLAVSSSATGVAWKATRADFAAIDCTNIHYGDQLIFRFFRNPGVAADNYGEDAGVLTIGFHYEQDSLGSYSVSRKR